MDILEQYEKELSQQPRQVPQWESSDEYGWPTRFVIRYSGGRIQNEKQANYILVGFTVAAIIVSFFLIFDIRLDTSRDKAGIDQMMKLHPDLIKK